MSWKHTVGVTLIQHALKDYTGSTPAIRAVLLTLDQAETGEGR